MAQYVYFGDIEGPVSVFEMGRVVNRLFHADEIQAEGNAPKSILSREPAAYEVQSVAGDTLAVPGNAFIVENQEWIEAFERVEQAILFADNTMNKE